MIILKWNLKTDFCKVIKASKMIRRDHYKEINDLKFENMILPQLFTLRAHILDYSGISFHIMIFNSAIK